jgi:magnesium transporter
MTSDQAPEHDAARETAASHMVSHVPRVLADRRVEDVIASLRGARFECADAVFVTDPEGRLEGIVRINDLLAASGQRMSEIMEPEHRTVRLSDDQEHIAVVAMEHDMIAVPVVDDQERFVGAVPPEALLNILRAEHMEDLQRLAGITPHPQGPYLALDAPLHDRFRRRLPWLVFGLFASFVLTSVMVSFERTLSANVTVAFFVPALVYIAGAIGTQAVSVAVRALAAGSMSLRALLRDELVIGFAIGVSLGLIALVAVLVVFGDWSLSLAVGLAVLGGGFVSATIGFGLPWAFQRAGSDPAMGSGPICTIIQDVASLSIYFVLVSAFVL